MKRQRGAAVVEAAIITPVFLLLIFAVLEFGLAFRSYLTLNAAAADSARTAAVAGNDENADYLLLQELAETVAPWGTENIQYVVVYRANGPGDPVPTSCLSGSVTDLCNHYTPAAFTNFDPAAWGCETTSLDLAFCPDDRETSLSAPAVSGFPEGPTYIGVHVQATHRYATGFIGDTLSISRTQVVRAEPELQ